jgi:hypothetical protein
MSQFTDILLVSPLADGKTWVIQRPFGYEVGALGSGELIDVSVGFQTDFASVPRLLWSFLPKWGRYGNAAVIHDFCYWDQSYTRQRADEIFREAMEVLQVPRAQISILYWGVRLFGWAAWAFNQRLRRQGKTRVVTPLPSKAVAGRSW